MFLPINNMPLMEYYKNGYSIVHGWLQDEILLLLDIFQSFHLDNNITGGFMEIGVHHGRLFFALAAIANNTDQGLAVDIFDNQMLNYDGSGKGNLKIFEEGLVKYVSNPSRVEIFSCDSLDKETIKKVSSYPDGFRWVSIDGGHTVQHIINDLHVAESNLVNGGFVLVDDYCNPGFPGVTEGLISYLLKGSKLVPVCAGGGKILITSLSYSEIAKDYFRKSLGKLTEIRSNASVLCGHSYIYFKKNTRIRKSV